MAYNHKGKPSLVGVSDKKINLRRYEDGTPSILRPRTNYADLYFYQKSNVLVQLTKVFCERFLPRYGDRTVDQMVQAARSIKQNIAEGLTDGQTSFEVEIKLLGIAKGSNQELLEDYQDYLKHNGLSEWANTNRKRFDKLHDYCTKFSTEDAYSDYYTRWTDEEMANCAICLCHMVDKAMTSFIEKRDREFVSEGGIRERMTAARLDMRKSQSQVIAEQAHKIEELTAQIASLQRELAVLRSSTNGVY